jgi:nitrous oxidase accessory protein NosD
MNISFRMCMCLLLGCLAAGRSEGVIAAQQAAAVMPVAPLSANSVAGKDIGDRVNQALKSCGLQCTVYIPAGNYSFATTIQLPLNPFGRYKLTGDPGAILTYSGSGDAISTPIGVQPGASQLLIEGFQLKGNVRAAAGIHLLPTNRITVRNMAIMEFSNGDGILVEGTNSSNIEDNLISGNRNGIRLIPTLCSGSQPIQCGASVNGAPYAANAIHVTHNQITHNAHWAIFEDAVIVGHGLTESQNNLYEGNNFEENGLAGPAFGAIYLTRSRGDIITANYFEKSPRQVVLGIPGAGNGYRAYGVVVRDNFFTALASTPFNIEIENADSAMVEGNSELVATIGANNCFINIVGETRTWISKNAIYQKNSYCFNGAPGVPPPGDGSSFFGVR